MTTLHELASIFQWCSAYKQFIVVLSNIDGRKIKKVIEIGRFLQPDDQIQDRGYIQNLVYRGKQYIKQSIKSMWKVVKLKFIVDIISMLSCFLVKLYTFWHCYTYHLFKMFTWDLIKEYLIGTLILNMWKEFSSIMNLKDDVV